MKRRELCIIVLCEVVFTLGALFFRSSQLLWFALGMPLAFLAGMLFGGLWNNRDVARSS